jgi:peptidyl-prolyl cis-trans isomerase SurA
LKYSRSCLPHVIIVLLLLSGTAWSGFAETLDAIIAVVNDDVITERQLNRYVERVKMELQQRHTELPPADILRKQALEHLVMMQIQLQLAEQTGLRVDDETLNKAISNIATGNHMDLSQFRDTIEKQGYSFTQFREDIRQEIITTKLRQKQVDNMIHVTDREIDNQIANNARHGEDDTEYHLGHILVATPEAASAEAIETARTKAETLLKRLRTGEDFRKIAVAESDESSQALDGGDLGWRRGSETPGAFADALKTMHEGEISGLLRGPSGFHIIKLLGMRTSGPHMIKQTHARHILLKPNELQTAEQVRARLRQLKARLEGGEKFAELARSHSDDKGSAAKGGELGWVSPGDLVPKFEEAMNNMNLNQISEPFETEFGWHIVQVLERRDHDDSKELVRNRARDAIRQRKAEDERQSWLRRLRDEAYVEYRQAN